MSRIQLTGCEGRNVQIDAGGYEDFPMAELMLEPPAHAAIFGVTLFEQSGHRAMRVVTTQPAESEPSRLPIGLPADVELPGGEKSPYARHVDELTMAEWWAVALRLSTLVSVEFEVPGEDLVIAMKGQPNRYGPAVLEVRDREGKVLKRFEREQVPVRLVPQ